MVLLLLSLGRHRRREEKGFYGSPRGTRALFVHYGGSAREGLPFIMRDVLIFLGYSTAVQVFLTSTSGRNQPLPLQKQKGRIRELLGLSFQEEIRCWGKRGRVKKTAGLGQRNTSSRERPHTNGNESPSQSRAEGQWGWEYHASLPNPVNSIMGCTALKNLKYKGDHTCMGAPSRGRKSDTTFPAITCTPSMWAAGDEDDGPRGTAWPTER